MDERDAWQMFCKTGKPEDYIKYTIIRDSGFRNSVVPPDIKSDADKNGRNNYKGTDSGRE